MDNSKIHSLYNSNNEINDDIIGNDIVIYGTGGNSSVTYKNLVLSGKCNLIGFYNSNKKIQGKTIFSKKILTEDELMKLPKDTKIVLGTLEIKFIREMEFDLLDKGFQKIYSPICGSFTLPACYNIESSKNILSKFKEEIKFVYENLEDSRSKEVYSNLINYRLSNDIEYLYKSEETSHKQYFPGEDIFKIQGNDIFIDAGACSGDTLINFANCTNKTYKKIYAFEPNKNIIDTLKEEIKLHKLENVEIIEKGLYSHKETLKFTINEKLIGSSRIDKNGLEIINTISLDEFMENKDEKITFIKMDIEGSERQALEGMKKTIEKYHPNLAICVYHFFEDLWTIPYSILKRYPGYKIYLRHYKNDTTETVLYCRWEGK